MPQHALIAGGSGTVGTELSKALTKAGHKVTILSRTGGENRITWDDLKVSGLPDGIDTVVSLCGSRIFRYLRWTKEAKEEVYNSRVETNKTLAKAIMKCTVKPSCFIVGTALTYYPMGVEGEVDEYTAKTDDTYLANLVEDWEKAAQLPEGFEDVRRVTIRIGMIFHSIPGYFFDNTVHQYKRFMGGTVGSGQIYTSWIHIDDLIGIFMHAITNKSVNGVLNGNAPNDVTSAQFSAMLAQKLHRPNLIRIPEFLVRWIAGRDRADALSRLSKIVPKRTLESGYKYKFENLDEALDDLLKAYE